MKPSLTKSRHVILLLLIVVLALLLATYAWAEVHTDNSKASYTATVVTLAGE